MSETSPTGKSRFSGEYELITLLDPSSIGASTTEEVVQGRIVQLVNETPWTDVHACYETITVREHTSNPEVRIKTSSVMIVGNKVR